jgi:predicted DNA-binding transcriptional regulator YafY
MKQILQRLHRLDHLIRIKGTGTPAQLARRIGVSERSVYVYLNLMRENGAPIKFCNMRKSYYYLEEGRFYMSFINKKSALY